MSDMDEEIQQIASESIGKRKPKIAKSTGKPDKRSITSIANAKKAGQIKLSRKQMMQQNEEDSDDYDDGVFVIKAKQSGFKPKPAPPANIRDDYVSKKDFDEIKTMMTEMAAAKKAKLKAKKEIPPPAAIQPKIETIDEHLKKRILNF